MKTFPLAFNADFHVTTPARIVRVMKRKSGIDRTQMEILLEWNNSDVVDDWSSPRHAIGIHSVTEKHRSTLKRDNVSSQQLRASRWRSLCADVLVALC
jgi:hypothetical protein